MKTILQYLNERYDEAWDYCIRCSKSYGIPKDGMEEEYAEAVRDCEIVHALIEIIKAQGNIGNESIQANKSLLNYDGVENFYRTLKKNNSRR